MKTATKAAPPETPLRAAQKDLTRRRIREAARRLFYEAGFAHATVEQIAVASGVSRATFYLHFKDKEEIAEDIIKDYAPRANERLRALPGPQPTTGEVRAWLDDMVAFVDAERVSLALLHELGHRTVDAPPYVTALLEGLIDAFAERLPAFRTAARPGEHQLEARVRAEIVIRDFTWSCETAARKGITPACAIALDVTAESFHAFTSNPRFSRPDA